MQKPRTPKPMTRSALLLSGLLVLLTACESQVQTSSGRDYLSSYAPQASLQSEETPALDIDEAIVAAADVQPLLRFPARIGLARIDQGRMTAIPQAEAEHWQGLAAGLGPDWGEFLPISPLIATLTTQAIEPKYRTPCERNYDACVADTVRKVRLGAARQHVDAVLIYEGSAWSKSQQNPLAVTDLTIIGLWVAPSRKLEAGAAAQALLLDVRNGYTYGFARAEVAEGLSSLSSYVGSDDRAASLRDRALGEAVAALIPEVEHMFLKLRIQLAEQNRQRPAVKAPANLVPSNFSAD